MTIFNAKKVKEEHIAWIDNASYEELLRRWRFASFDDTIFHGDTGDYYAKKMKEKQIEVGHDAHVRASKSIGWEK